MDGKKMLTVTSVADLLEVSPSTIYRLIKTEELPAVKIGQRQVRIRQEDLTAYIESHLVSSRATKALASVKVQESTLATLPENDRREKEDQNREVTFQDQGKLLTRRRFIQGSFSLVLAAVASLAGTIGATLIYDEFARRIGDQRQQELLEQQRLASIESLFGGLYSFSWTAGLTHLIQDYGITRFSESSNVLASISLGAALGLRGGGWLEKAIYTKDLPGPVIIDGDVIAVGSPTSDVVAKASFEYIGTRYELKRVANPLIELPITYVLDKDELSDEDSLLRRYVAGEEKEMYNWAIRVENELLLPKLGASRWLQTDYLLITRMPNILSRKAFFAGSEILIIGGTHGTGTEAIKLVFQDGNLLSQINTKREGAQSFQALIPIVELANTFDGVRMHTIPIRLGTPIVKPINVDIEHILYAWQHSKA